MAVGGGITNGNMLRSLFLLVGSITRCPFSGYVYGRRCEVLSRGVGPGSRSSTLTGYCLPGP